MNFNSKSPSIMHIDLNSCFATIEQQANPLLRGKPIAVAAYCSPRGCILAASVEAKRLGIKTGMRVMDGTHIYPRLIVLPSDPNKYRHIHIKLKNLISGYTNDFVPKSIDEFVLNLENYIYTYKDDPCTSMQKVAKEIKQRIKSEIGDWLTVSIGISTNRYLAKIAAGLHKPDGLDEINSANFLNIYSSLKLTDLTGIKNANASRLNSVGIYSVLDFYNSPVWKLKAAFHSITGLYWHTRMHGYEVDAFESNRKSFGNSVAIGRNLSNVEEIFPILARLTEKMCGRLRNAGYNARGIHLGISYKDGSWWHKGRQMGTSKFDSVDFYRGAFRLLLESPSAGANPPNALNIAVSCFDLDKDSPCQLDLFNDVPKRQNLTRAVDGINKRWGDFTVYSIRSMNGAKAIMDRISFGGIKELEESIIF